MTRLLRVTLVPADAARRPPQAIPTPAEHAYLIRTVLQRELNRLEEQAKAQVGSYTAAEEVRAALDSLAALERPEPSPHRHELRQRVAWMKDNWVVAGRVVMLRLIEDLFAEMERVAGPHG